MRCWHEYPYNAALGGPCNDWREWLTSPDCIAAQKNRWQFILERWGGSPNILAWDLMNEIELYWGCTPEEMYNYISEIATFVRETEMALYGKAHMLTVSSAAPVPDIELGRTIFNHPALDFANTHVYAGLGVMAPVNAIECAEETAGAVKLALHAIGKPRPFFDSESGPIDVWIEDLALDTAYHHNMSWAHLAAGGAGSGMRWPYTEPHWLVPEMRDNLLGLARFAAAVDWTHFESRNMTSSIRLSKGGILKAGCADGYTAIVWLLADARLETTPTLGGTTVYIVNALRDGTYCIDVWDTNTGMPITGMIAQVTDGKLAFTLPHFATPPADVALLIRVLWLKVEALPEAERAIRLWLP
ncbi:MAG: hypothetical protein HC828_10065 [Blastochloris sp.]|nr:hypothetical protein [Blastochloris sp.]